jgi:hypothetical protein
LGAAGISTKALGISTLRYFEKLFFQNRAKRKKLSKLKEL